MTPHGNEIGTARTYAHRFLRAVVAVAVAVLWIVAVRHVGAQTIAGPASAQCPKVALPTGSRSASMNEPDPKP